MKKLLLSMGLMLTAALSSLAAEASWSVTFKNGTNNTGAQLSSSTVMADICDSGAEYLSDINSASRTSLGLYGLKVGENKNSGDIIFDVAADAQVIPTKIDVQVSANKNPATLIFKVNGNECKLATSNTNDTYATVSLTDFTEPLAKLSFERATSTAQGFIYVKSVTVYYNEGEAPLVSAPTISGAVDVDKYVVTITGEEGAEIHYTTDDSEPTKESPLYSEPFELWESATVKAVAFKGDDASNAAVFKAEVPYFLEDFSQLIGIEEDGGFKGAKVVINGKMTVIYQAANDTRYMYVNCGNNNMLFFSPGIVFTPGDTFTHAEATVAFYGKTVQLTNITIGKVTSGTPIEPTEATLEDVKSNALFSYFTIGDLTISGVNGSDATATDANGNSVALRNQFKITDGFEDATGCTITGFVGVFNGNVQFQPTVIEVGQEVVEAPVITPADGAIVPSQTQVKITAEEGATIYCKTSLDDEFYEYDEWSVYVLGEDGSTFVVEAYAEKDGVKSEIVTATYTIGGKLDPQISWVNENYEPISEFTWVIGETTIEQMPYMDGYFTVNPEISSSNPEVATVDIEGNPWLTIIGPGTTVITLSVPETEEYTAGSADLTLTVVDPTSEPATADGTFNFADFSSLSFSTAIDEPTQASTGVQIEDNTLTANGIVLSFTKESGTGVRFWNGTATAGTSLRIYNGSSMTLTAPADYYVTRVEFTEVSSNNWGLQLAAGEPGTFESKTWLGTTDDKANSITFEVPTGGTNTFIKTITVVCSKIPSGIGNIEAADDNAPVEYYNLQGIRVMNPENGLYIRRQGSKVSKVIL